MLRCEKGFLESHKNAEGSTAFLIILNKISLENRIFPNFEFSELLTKAQNVKHLNKNNPAQRYIFFSYVVYCESSRM